MSASSSAPLQRRSNNEVPKTVETTKGEKSAQHIAIVAGGIGTFALGMASFVVALTGRIDPVLTVLSVVTTAGATIVVARFTKRLFEATQALERGAQATLDYQIEATEREQRGYVFYLRRVLEWQPTGMNIRFKNTGRTPVKNVEVVGYASDSDAFPLDSPVTETFSTVMAPDGELDVHFKDPLIEKHVIESIALGGKTKPLYIYGQVRYTDAFGWSRTTTFRYRLDKNDLRNCPEGNDWT